jgi:Na+/H+ antiporter NhaD/arsenite permease-like protein
MCEHCTERSGKCMSESPMNSNSSQSVISANPLLPFRNRESDGIRSARFTSRSGRAHRASRFLTHMTQSHSHRTPSSSTALSTTQKAEQQASEQQTADQTTDHSATATSSPSTESVHEKTHEFVSDPSNPHFYVHDHYGQPHFNYKARQSHLLHSHDLAVRSRQLLKRLNSQGWWSAIWGVIRSHLFLSILIAGSVITSFFNTPRWSYVDWHIIAIIFELMIVIAAFERYGVLNWVSMRILARCKTEKGLSISMCMLALILAMFATNDVTILTIIPLVLLMKKHSKTPLYLQMTLVTICANLGSCLTPFGNPHNLYIYTHFHLSDLEFMRYSVPLFVTSLVLIFISLAFVKKTPITIDRNDIPHLVQPRRVIPFAILAAVVFVNLRVNDWRMDLTCAIIAALTAYVFDPRLIFHINWNLILTLFFIFIMIGNIAHMQVLQSGLNALVHTPMATYLSGLLLSQIISNVPITVLLSQFTASPAALFFGVDIGGLGSPIASLANLITISLFNKQYPNEKKAFLKVFLGVNFAALIFMGTLFGVLQAVKIL